MNADADNIYAAALESVSEMNKWMPWCHSEYSLQESQSWLYEQSKKWESEDAFEFAIVDEVSAYLGGCGINQINKEYQTASLGYWVRTSAAGQGIATEAVSQLAAWAFANTKLIRLEILCAVGNTRSQRVAEKVGATNEGLLRSRLVLNQEVHDAVVYSIVRGDRATV